MGYGNSNDTMDNSFLVDSIFREFKYDSNQTNELPWQNDLHKILINKIIQSIKEGGHLIEITDEDISKMEEKDEFFHSTYTAFFSLIKSDDEIQIVLNSVGGPRASSWLGRFAL
ncbi:MAG: hypothetical protein ABIT58_05740 [Ferruginibacter sp.]